MPLLDGAAGSSARSAAVAELVRRAWGADPSARPTFAQLTPALRGIRRLKEHDAPSAPPGQQQQQQQGGALRRMSGGGSMRAAAFAAAPAAAPAAAGEKGAAEAAPAGIEEQPACSCVVQ
jgi:hypothetical protein